MPTSPPPLPPKGSGFQLVALVVAVAGVVGLGTLLDLAVPARPAPVTSRAHGVRTAYVFPQLLGITPQPTPQPESSPSTLQSRLEADREGNGSGGVSRPLSSASPRATAAQARAPASRGQASSGQVSSGRIQEGAQAAIPPRRGRQATGASAGKPAVTGSSSSGTAVHGTSSPQKGNSTTGGQEKPVVRPLESAMPTPTPGRTAGAPPPRAEAAPEPVGETREPRVTRRVEPLYPPIARSQGISGRVTVRITVAADGSVENVKIEQSTSPLFNQAALKAAKQMRFEPGLVNGKPVRADYLQTFNFRTR